MKKISFSIVLVFLLFSYNSSQAQVWKQIQNAAQKKALDKANQRVQTKTDQAVDKSLDGLEASLMGGFTKNKIDPSAVPNSYNFSYKYISEIKTNDGKAITAYYLLEPNVSYFGFNVGQEQDQNMLVILDAKNKITVTCFGDKKKKMAMASEIPEYSDIEDKEQSKFVFKTLANKTIMGYNCKGIQATNQDHDIIFYFTNEAPVSFGEMYKNQKGQKNQSLPEGIANYFKPGEKALMMDMTMKELKNKGKVTTMKCISLDKSAYVFNKSDYKFM